MLIRCVADETAERGDVAFEHSGMSADDRTFLKVLGLRAHGYKAFIPRSYWPSLCSLSISGTGV